jgi:itaconate CoA-transferase
VIAHTQLSERDRWREIDSEVVLCGRSFRHPRRPTQPRMDGVPAGGQHTDSVLRDLGFGPHDIDELREDGVVR